MSEVRKELVWIDKVVAYWFGWEGNHTISAECGSIRKNCVFCRVVCYLLNLRWPDHCVNAAKQEGLL